MDGRLPIPPIATGAIASGARARASSRRLLTQPARSRLPAMNAMSRRGLSPVTRQAARSATALLAALLLAGCASGAGQSRLAVPVTLPKPATLEGTLHLPSGPGPFPAVILLHGCSGPSPAVTTWALWLKGEGYAALELNSFSGRGLTRLCANSAPLTGGARSSDVYAAAEALKQLGTIDGSRIGAMGFSHGGWTVLWAERYQGRHPDTKLRALVAVYPGGCGELPGFTGAVPTLLLLGAKDDWTPAAPCEVLAGRAKDLGQPVKAVTYPDAGHAFDGAHLVGRVFISDARGGRGATLWYDPAAHADAEKQVRAFLAEYLKR